MRQKQCVKFAICFKDPDRAGPANVALMVKKISLKRNLPHCTGTMGNVP